jgi:hypothetical protein
METILSYLKDIKLSLADWIAITVVTAFSGLLAALKIQGTRLHRAQVVILEQTAAQGTQKAKDQYQTALTAFLKAGGTLLLLLFLATPANAQPYAQCWTALSACDKLTRQQDVQITALQKGIDTNPVPSFWQSIPWPVWVVVGAAVGFGVGRSVK